MPQEIYNEGRVVGLSAWEIFKRQALSNNVPENEIPNEREWISSMIGSGASMILRIPSGTPAGVNDFELPSTSNLSAAGTIVANPFIGTCECDASNWAKKVTSYGPLILNDKEHYPNPQHAEGVPEIPSDTDYSSYVNSVNEFNKITDGIVYTKNANWLSCGFSEEDFLGTGEQTEFLLRYSVISVTSLTIDDVEVPDTDYTIDATGTPEKLIFNTAPENDAKIHIRYSAHSSPEKDIDPNFNSSSTVVRLIINSATTSDAYVLFTGFTNKRILQTVSGYAVEGEDHSIGGSADTELNNWPNGGMLGPEIIPWATKIVFCVPSLAYDLANSLTRKIPSDGTITDGEVYGYIFTKSNTTIRPKSLVDLNSILLTDYYNDPAHPFEVTPTLRENVSSFSLGSSDQGNILTAWYPGMTAQKINALTDSKKFFPPALYATQVKQNGEQVMVPLDIAAPGTVKGFIDSTQAANYKNLLPDNYAFYYDKANNLVAFAIKNVEVKNWPGLAKIIYSTAPTATINAGTQSLKVIALNDNQGHDYDTSGSSGNIPVGPDGNLSWQNLLTALANNNKVDILGARLHALGNEMTVTEEHTRSTIGVAQDNQIDEIAAAKVTVTGSYPVSMTTSQNTDVGDTSTDLLTLQQNSSIKVGADFIEFGNGLRLYISNQEPSTANVPVGSIGIGWDASDNSNDPVITEPGEIIGEHSVPPTY